MTNRPLTFDDYVGQERVKNQLRITMGACERNRVQLPHLLFAGPPGLGKTTIAKIIANRFGGGVGYHEVMASSLNTQEDVEEVLCQLSWDRPDILFIDEIHRLNPKIEELLYPAMEDFEFEAEWKENGRSIKERFSVPKFTLIGATTLAGDLSRPLRDRFGLHFNMQNYDVQETKLIVQKLAEKRNVQITEEASEEIAKRSKGVARIAINYFNRCLEYTHYMGMSHMTKQATDGQFGLLGIDEMGLDSNDYKVLSFLATQTSPCGLDTIATGTNIDKGTVANMIEPYLVQKGLMNRTRSGRIITDVGLGWICDNSDIELSNQSRTTMQRRGQIRQIGSR